MNAWHYNDSGKQQGPISTNDLKAKLAAGELSGASLVWQVGTKDWAEVRTFPELVGLIQTPPPLPKSVTVAAGAKTTLSIIVDAIPALGIMMPIVALLTIAIIEASEINGWFVFATVISVIATIAFIYYLRPKTSISPPSHAWRRFAAKVLDVDIACAAGVIADLIFSPSGWQSFVLLFLGTALFVWFLFEVPMQGKSLGRHLFGLKLMPMATGNTSPNYLARFIKLNIFGMALGIPVVAAITSAISYKKLRETGTTRWDENEFSVAYSESIAGDLPP